MTPSASRSEIEPTTVETGSTAEVRGLAFELRRLLAGAAPRVAGLRSEAERASGAILEALGHAELARSVAERRRNLLLARERAFECAELLDVMRVRRVVDVLERSRARALVTRLCTSLGRLVSPPRREPTGAHRLVREPSGTHRLLREPTGEHRL
jgi:hypothetical protein